MNALSVLTISQLNMYVKSLLDGDSSLNRVFVSGEISNFTNHYRSGHLYLSLKDEKCVIKAVMFSSYASRLRFEPKDGMKVLVRGRVSLYEQSGQYQLYIEDMQPDGLGALNLAYEQLKEKLAAEGIQAEVLDLRTLVPLDWDAIVASVSKTHNVIVVSEEVKRGSYAAEISAQIAEELFDELDAPVERVCGLNIVSPFSPTLEDENFPHPENIVAAVKKVLNR